MLSTKNIQPSYTIEEVLSGLKPTVTIIYGGIPMPEPMPLSYYRFRVLFNGQLYDYNTVDDMARYAHERLEYDIRHILKAKIADCEIWYLSSVKEHIGKIMEYKVNEFTPAVLLKKHYNNGKNIV